MEQSISDKIYHAAPFRHQVGGHGPVVALEGTTFVAKPLDTTEFAFYKDTPPELCRFVSAFHGLASVKFCSTAIDLASKENEAGAAESKDNGGQAFTPVNAVDSDAVINSPHGNERSSNPWSITMYKKQLASSKTVAAAGTVPCMLLDNLIDRLEYPCLLDIKVGTRLYDDNADPVKRERCLAKASSTTSMQMGIRICGMQVYHPESGRYMCQDKYMGRTLTSSTISNALRTYFDVNNGSPAWASTRTQWIVASILNHIRELRSVIESLNGKRFWSSSLLVMYDGDINVDKPKVDVKMIDFAHTVHYTNGPESETPDEGYIFGLNNLEKVLDSILVEPQPETSSSPPLARVSQTRSVTVDVK